METCHVATPRRNGHLGCSRSPEGTSEGERVGDKERDINKRISPLPATATPSTDKKYTMTEKQRERDSGSERLAGGS